MKKIITLLLTAVTLTFSTHSDGQSIVNMLSEGFETSSFPPSGGWIMTSVPSGASTASCLADTTWKLLASNTLPCTGNNYTVAAHGGSKLIGYNSWNLPGGSYSDLITPVLDFSSPAGYYRVSFWMWRQSGGDTVKAFVNTTPTSVGGTLLGFVQSGTGANPPASSGNGWYQYTFNIPSSFNTPTNYIIFKAASANGFDVFIDDIAVEHILPCTVPAGQPMALSLAGSYSAVTGSFTAPSPIADGYIVVRTSGPNALNANPVNGTTYKAGDVIGNGTVVAYNNKTTFSDGNLLSAGNYTYTIFSYNTLCSGGPLYLTTTPLTGNVSTISIPTVYTWSAAKSADFNDPASWVPARNVPDPNDLLIFNNGIADTAVNVPTQTVTRVSISSNTTVRWRSTATNTFTIASDNNSSTDELSVANGSSLILDGDAALALAFSGTGGTNNINGTLEVATNTGTTNLNTINFSNSTTTVAGTLAAGGAAGGSSNNVFTSTGANLIINGNYIHKYVTTGGSAVPTATWGGASNLQITSLTATGSLSGLGQTFNNVTYNCPGQTAAVNISAGTNLTVNGNFTVTSTGTGTLGFATTNAYTFNFNNYVQTGGAVDLSTGSTASAQIINILGTFNQTGGTLKSSNTNASGAPTLSFNSTTAAQNANFFNTAPAGRVVIRVNNGRGINLTGSGTLTTTFTLNSGGGIRVSTLAANPINTTLTLSYSSASLIYDTLGNATIPALLFPTTGAPTNLTVNVGIGNVVTLPFSRTVAGTLTLTTGDLNIGTNILTMGTGASSAGTIAATGGSIRMATGGAITRWYATGALPTTATSTNVGFYPISYGGANRSVNIYGTGNVTTAGTITVAHADPGGLTTGLSVIDLPSYTINSRTNGFWTFSQSNIAVTAGVTLGVKVSGAAMVNPIKVDSLRLMQATSVVGNHVTGTAPANAERNGLTLAQLTGNFYIGAASGDIGNLFIATTTGNWSSPGTWLNGQVPTIADVAVINSGVTVTVDASNNVAKALTNNGTLVTNNAANTLTVDSAIVNNNTINVSNGTLKINGGVGANGIINTGVVNVSGGTFTVGAAAGYNNKPFTNNGGLNVTGGTLNINGNLNSILNSTFAQSAGLINVDGNAGGVAANSVAAGTAIVSFKTPLITLTGGTFTIVDPHAASSTATNTFEYNGVANQHVNAGINHTFRMGNGVSTDAGGDGGFSFKIHPAVLASSKFAFGNLIISSGTGTNRTVIGSATGSSFTPSTLSILGNLTINSGGELRMGNAFNVIYLNGNLVVDGTLTTLGVFNFANYVSGAVVGSTGYQTVSGSGTFRNGVTPPTFPANFFSFGFQNSFGVIFNNNISFSNALSFTGINGLPAKVYMSNNSTMIENSLQGFAGSTDATKGWVVGKYTKPFNNSIAGNTNGVTFPIGDSTNYAPVKISGQVIATTNGTVTASTTPGNHPNLASITLNKQQTAKRYYTIASSNVTGTGISIVFQFPGTDVTNGDPTTFKVARYNGAVWSYPTTGTATFTVPLYMVPDTGQTEQTIDGQYLLAGPCIAPAIAAHPQSQVICPSLTATFSVFATGSNLTYQWYKGVTLIPGAQSSSYTIVNAQTLDNGNYNVIVTNACGATVTSNNATLTVGSSAPTITTQPLSQTICTGRPVTFNVAAVGTGFTYQWYKGSNPINLATGTFYTIPSTVSGDAATYTVKVTSSCSGVATSGNAVLTVNTTPTAPTVTAGGPTTFCLKDSVVLTASSATGTYQWLQDGSGVGTNSLTFTAKQSANYSVTLTNNGCSATSATKAVTALSLPLTSVTAAGPTTFCDRNSVVLNAPVGTGYTYQWKDNAGNISGATSITYTATTTDDYVVTVKDGNNCTATTVTPMHVTVNPLPSVAITASGPATFCDHDSLVMTVPVTSGAIYQWQRNRANILYSPISVTDTIYTATTAGDYRIASVITATGCTDTSVETTVVVKPSPDAIITPNGPTTFCEGDSVELSVNTGTGYTYQWTSDNADIPGATTATYKTKVAAKYNVKVTNTDGCTTTSLVTRVAINILPNPVIVQHGNVLSVASGATLYQWFLNGQAIQGATDPTYTMTQLGSYKVVVTNGNGCSDTSDAKEVTDITGVASVHTNTTVSVYPNPSANIIHISAPVDVNVTISALDGKQVIYKVNAKDIDVSQLANAVYMIRVTDANGALLKVEKLIKTGW